MIWRRLVVSLVLVLVGWSAQSASGATRTKPRRSRAGLAALTPRIDPNALAKVPAVCVDGKGGWRKVAAGTAHDAMRSALEAFPWKKRRYVEPDWDCRLELDISCAPDLNGDNKKDFLVRARSRMRTRAAKGKACESLDANDRNLKHHEVILVMQRAGSATTPEWRAVDVVSFTSDAALGSMSHARVSFVKLRDGKTGFAVKTQTGDRGAGCAVLGYWVGALIDGRVKKIGEADPEFCVPD